MQDLPVRTPTRNLMSNQQPARDEQITRSDQAPRSQQFADDKESAADQQIQQIVGKLVHDLRTPLSILSMGIEAIRMTQHDPSQCDALCDMMAKEGVESMKRILEQAANRAN